MKIVYIVVILFVLLFPSRGKYEAQGYNKYTVMLGGTVVGVTDSLDDIYEDYRIARLEIANENDDGDLCLVDYLPITYEGEEVVFGVEDNQREIVDNMKNILNANKVTKFEKSYSVKVNSSVINVNTAEEVTDIFQTVIDKYSGGEGFVVTLEGDKDRELSVLAVSINKTGDDIRYPNTNDEFDLAAEGAEAQFETDGEYEVIQELSFDSFDYGIVNMGFSEDIEVCEAYVPASVITPYDEAKNYFTEAKEVQQIYTVESGDTLSEISMKVNLPLDDIIALNDSLENERSLIVPGQELIITSPKPPLGVLWSYIDKVNEVYDLPTEYVYNDSWYSNQSVTLQQPSAGSHEAVVLVSKENTTDVASAVMYEEVLADPVAKRVEIGTIVPPTYIKPLSGGRQTSGFGGRKSPTKGASSNHKGIDWATPTGTTVVASCGGTVVFAGWGRGYGNVIYINHPDGRQTRYGHLSRILVSNGQTVSQGERIAYSGNTGISTGPHVHFEILINGVQVNPLNYIN